MRSERKAVTQDGPQQKTGENMQHPSNMAHILKPLTY
jgi:hypothetical protein